MDWNDRLRWIRWRSLEEGDVEGSLLGPQVRSEATRQAGLGDDFLPRRTTWLDRYAELHPEKLGPLLALMRGPRCSLAAWLGWLAALTTGYLLTELGAERMINLLAVPLMGVLAWNVVVITASLLVEWRGFAKDVPWPAWLRWRPGGADVESKGPVTQRTVARFRSMAEPLIASRLQARGRAWLHMGAALFALGTIAGMYAKGWSREYQVVWESTLFDAGTAKSFLAALYRPASHLFHLPLPLDNFEALRAGPGRAPVPGEALPWIHLYAATLLLLVLLPRLSLTLLALWRGQQSQDHAWARLDWRGYTSRLQNTIAGTGQQIEVLAYSWRVGEEPRERWSSTLRDRFGGMSMIEFHAIPAGDEDSYVERWRPRHPLVAVVFNAASTPEAEVHAVLCRDLRLSLRSHLASARFVVLLDVTSLEERRTPEAADARLKLWHSMLHEWVDEIVCTRSVP